MPRSTMQVLKFRRRRESKTNYVKRLALVKGNMDRIVVRKSNRRIIGQIVRYDEKGDVVRYSADSNELKAMGWPSRSNKPTAYLTGILLGSKIKAEDKGSEFILDIGLSSPVKDSIPFVFAKGCIEGGMKVRGNIEIEQKAYDASLIANYAKELKEKDQKAYQRQFGSYIKENVQIEEMPKLFAEAKQKIMKK
ncbi:MAG: 50S ribosomal protein L18 [Candidatus Micrarchaeota archaeon]|nr:50S ribosomal protein L18 [Candidatus Micrarchaeota archaeon]MDE1846456.1 50S ribosomal protein L18 [Candidatus Micrarchaeota archaeon]